MREQRFLFRGVNCEMDEAGVALRPKQQEAFEYAAHYGEASYGSGATYGISAANAVIRHQIDQRGHPTSGLSTTPVFQRAVVYATNGSNGREFSRGYVYKIDRRRFSEFGIREFVVREYVNTPSVPEDDEVILVVSGRVELPPELVVEKIEVFRAAVDEGQL